MWKTVAIILIGLFALQGLAAASEGYEVGTITAVLLHEDSTGNASAASYEVSVKVGNTTYVVLYTPPLETRTVQYAAGRQMLVRVGEKSIAFNDDLGATSEVPILSRSAAPQPAPTAYPTLAPVQSVELLGLPGIKNNTKGTLSVDGDKLCFASSKGTADIPLANVDDVLTGNDSQRVIRGKVGTVSMFGPYGSGRFLSLFRSKLDTVTVQYRDSEGGLHGVVFTMPVGQADPFKKELVARGAHSSAVIEVEASADSSKPLARKEKP